MMDEQNRFITDASHELKTPLTALRTEFEVAMLDGEKIPHKSAVQLIKSGYDEIVELQRLTEDLMELTTQQKRKNSITHEDVSLLEIIEAALKNVIPLAKQKHIVIQNEIDDYSLDGESSSLGKLFTILLDNAIKYSPNKKEIKIASRKSDHHIDVTVSDQGIGINEKDIAHIFDRFYRADKSRSQISGYGLGLSIAKEIVKSHKGSISVESKPGQGTIFTVQLPLRKTA
jgi:signal transduction histidine kinase